MCNSPFKPTSKSFKHANGNINKKINPTSTKSSIDSDITDLAYSQNQIPWFPVRTFISFLFDYNLSIQRQARWYLKIMLNSLSMYFLTLTRFTRFLDDFSCPPTTITHTLHLLKDTRCKHMFDNFDSPSTALIASNNVLGIFCSNSGTVFADNVFLDLDLDVTAGV
jgi:hypothetical protein